MLSAALALLPNSLILEHFYHLGYAIGASYIVFPGFAPSSRFPPNSWLGKSLTLATFVAVLVSPMEHRSLLRRKTNGFLLQESTQRNL